MAFTAQSNGNAGAGNVSKMPMRSLLYPGATTKMYAGIQPWFGGTNHMNVGYDSADPVQIQKQVADMISRGLDGAIIDWYGFRQTRENTSASLMLHDAELHPGFEVAVMLDGGVMQWGACSGCSPTEVVIEQLNYAAQTFYSSPAYMLRNGRPLMFEFGLEDYAIDWSQVLASVQGNPMIVWEHQTAGFDGRYSWVEPGNEGYLDWFYGDSLNDVANKLVFGSAFKGFNDTLAAWSANRIMSQSCGQEWLNTFATVGSYYSASAQLPNFQVATWNDYEEGTEIETGIDNCVSISAAVSGTSVTWSVSGNENTIDHYVVFISTDGANLMPLAQLAAGSYSLDLASYDLVLPGHYTLYVKAVGKASIRNQMSAGICFPGYCNDLIVAPSALTVSRGQSGSYTVALDPGGSFTAAVSLACSNLPAGATCSFSPSVVTPGSTSASTLSISTTSTMGGLRRDKQRSRQAPLYAFWSAFAGLGAAGMIILNPRSKKRNRKLKTYLALGIFIAILLPHTACGGGASSRSAGATPSGTYTIIITGTSGSMQRATTAVLNVQ